MKFELLPALDVMADLYERPLSSERFKAYLKLLHGNSRDLKFPVSGYNPMAKGYILEKINELKVLNAENLMSDVINEYNASIADHKPSVNFKVALNLLDDARGGWTNRFTSDYDNKFRISGYISRQFCLAIFWSSEFYTTTLVRARTIESMRRTAYWIKNPKPRTLKEHVEQEKFVHTTGQPLAQMPDRADLSALKRSYTAHLDSEDHPLIFNFLYGDDVSASLGYKTFGHKGLAAKWEILCFL